MKKKLIIGVAIYAIIMLFAVCLMTIFMEDRDAPTITFEKDVITYNEGEDVKLLLTDVKAQDEVEGDVSSTLTIESIHVLSNGHKASIMYAARDSKNNVVKKERMIQYVGKAGAEDDTNEVNPNQDGSESQTVLEDGTAEVSGDNILDQETETLDQTEDTIEEEPLVSTGAPIIRLNTHEVRIAVGGYFNTMNYIAEAVDDEDDVWRRIRIVGNYNTNEQGEYTLEYYITDRDGNKSNIETLVLVVE